MPALREIYVSTDIETDGPIVGVHSMLSIGSAVYTPEKELLGTFEANLVALPGAVVDSETMEWWKTQPVAWEACRKNLEDPTAAMQRYVRFLKALSGEPIFVANPAWFDYGFVRHYLLKLVGEDPFSRRTIDIRSFTMGLEGTDYRGSGEENVPPELRSKVPHTHRAIDDAMNQGEFFCNLCARRQAYALESR